MFSSVPPSTDEYELQTQEISTRSFMIIFPILLLILLLYTSLIRVTKTVTVETPTFIEYTHLNSTYPRTLTCPCAKISVNYGEFLYINYTLHQVCSSIFVDDEWIVYLDYIFASELISSERSTWTGSYGFQALKSFCNRINETISSRSIELNSTQYVSASVVSKPIFEAETESMIDQFRSTVTNEFLLFLRMIQDTTHANALFSALQSNYFLNDNNRKISTFSESYESCDCFTSSTCIVPSFFAAFRNKSLLLFNVTNFYTGCNVIESLLQSTLEYFYDQQHMDDLLGTISSNSIKIVTALNESLPSVYLKNSTIKEFLDNLMIEQWNFLSSFENYYNQCQPIKCIYTFETNNDIIYIVTTLSGIVGGLITILNFIVPRLVKLVRRIRNHQRPITGKVRLKMTTGVKIDDWS